MKKKLLTHIAGSVCLLVAMTTQAAPAATEEEKLIAEELKKLFTISPSITKLESPALKETINATIYDAKVTVKGSSGSSSSKMRVVKGEAGIVTLKRPNTNQDCPELKKVIKKDFKLKTEKDAKTLEAALDLLYPISDSFGGKHLKAKAIRREDGRVIFVRGEFFKDLKAFIFEIDESGTISKVSYTLRLKKK